MPWQVRSEQQRRLVAGGYRVRVVLRSGRHRRPRASAGRS
jgi:proline dehydrogenase